MDAVIRNATLPDGRTGIDIAIEGGRIAAVGPALPVQAGRTIDAGCDLVTPPFVDAHFHMDATLSYGLPRVNASGTLLEGIALWGELKPAPPRPRKADPVLWLRDHSQISSVLPDSGTADARDYS